MGLLDYRQSMIDAGLLQDDEEAIKKLAREMAHSYQGSGKAEVPEFMKAINERVTGLSANVLGLLGKGNEDTQAVASDYMSKIGQDMGQGARGFLGNAAKSVYGETPEIRQQAMMEGYGQLPFNTEALAPMMGGFGAMIAYHGSPYKFDKFSMSKIGTGEGAQAYGHGLYFAENPKVASEYSKNLSFGGKYVKVGNRDIQPLASNAKWTPEETAAANLLDAGGKFSLARNRIQNQYGKPDAILRDLDNLEKNGAKLVDPGNLYKVDIPDEHVAKMLDWDKPLSEQPESVRKAVKELLDFHQPSGSVVNANRNTGYARFDQDVTGAQAKELLELKLGKGGVEKALKDAGIPGIKYLDQGSRQGGKGTHNFVVFDPEQVKILERK